MPVEVEDLDDVGVIQPTDKPRLTHEHVDEGGVVRERRPNPLDDDLLLEPFGTKELARKISAIPPSASLRWTTYFPMWVPAGNDTDGSPAAISYSIRIWCWGRALALSWVFPDRPRQPRPPLPPGPQRSVQGGA